MSIKGSFYGTVSPNAAREREGGGWPKCHVTFFPKKFTIIFKWRKMASFLENKNVTRHNDGSTSVSPNVTLEGWGLKKAKKVSRIIWMAHKLNEMRSYQSLETSWTAATSSTSSSSRIPSTTWVRPKSKRAARKSNFDIVFVVIDTFKEI